MAAKKKNNDPSIDELSFEEALHQLESITSNMSDGPERLDNLMDNFEKGVKLADRCRKILDSAQRRVSKLTPTSDEIEL